MANPRQPNDRRYGRIRAAYQQTSREAWAAALEWLPAVERRILQLIEARNGATCNEIEDVTGRKHQTASAAIRGLVIGGCLVDSGIRRANAGGRRCNVWVLPLHAIGYSGPQPDPEPEPVAAAPGPQPSLFD